MRLLDEQHLLVRGEWPEVVSDVTFELIGKLTDLGHRGQHVVAKMLGLVGQAASVVSQRFFQRRDTLTSAAKELVSFTEVDPERGTAGAAS